MCTDSEIPFLGIFLCLRKYLGVPRYVNEDVYKNVAIAKKVVNNPTIHEQGIDE